MVERKDKKVLLMLCVFALIFLCTLTSTGCGSKDKEFIAEGETTLIENPTKDPSAYTANQQLYILAWQLKNVKSYKSVIAGQTESKMPKYVQHINNVHIKNGDESFSGAKSTSFLVNVGKQAYFKGDKVVCREATDILENAWSEDLNVITLGDYRSKLGSEATALSNYILNDETIISATSKKLASGEYEITAEIDPVKGTDRYKVQMMNYGGLKSEPEFKSCGFTITFSSDWMPKILVSTDDYKIDKGLLKLHCISTLTETFSNFNEDLTIPNVEVFREKINDNTSDLEENKEIEGNELLFNTILQMDTSKGIKINGTLDAIVEDKKVTLPVDGWMTFDLNEPGEDLNKAFTGYVTTNINNLPVSIFYIGDDYLYIDLGGVKYKYLLNSDKDNNAFSFDDLVQSIIIEEQERIDNFRRFNLTVSPLILNAMSKVISDFTSNLPENFNALKDLVVKDLTMGVTLVKKSPSIARITEVTLDGDFGIAKGHASVLIAEKPEKLPTSDELKDYIEGDWDNLLANFGFVMKVMNGFNAYNWNNGMNFNVNAGLFSEGNPQANMLFTFAMKAQDNNGIRAHLTFGLGALMGLPSEFYFENGNLYLVKTANEGTNVYASDIQVINVMEELGKLLPGLVGQGNIDATAILNELANLVLNSKVVATTLEDGTERFELYLPENVVKVLSDGYQSLIQKAKGMDLGDMGPLVAQLLTLFDFKLDDVIIRTEYKDNKITSFSLRLKNNSTSLVGAGKDVSLIVELATFKDAAENEIATDFEIIPNGLKAMEEGKEVKALMDKIVNNGLTHVGPSMGNVLKDALDKYNALSKAAQKTVLSYADFMKINNEYNKLNGDANKFIEALLEIEALEKEGSKDKEINDLLLKTMNPIYNKIDNRQVEYIGSYAINKYLEIRSANEKAYLVNEIIAMIDDLTVANYPTSKKLNDAINAANSLYLGLIEDNKALVTNYDKISEAKKAAHDLELNEFNAEILEYSKKANGFDNKTPYNTLRSEKSNMDKYQNKYNGLSDEDKKVITNYAEFKKAYDKFFNIVSELYTEAVKAIGGDSDIVKGDEVFNKIDTATKIGFLFNADLKTKFKDEMAKVSAWSKKHREIETKEVADIIAKIEKVEFTEECHNLILDARKAVNGIRKQYFGSITNRNKLQEYEANYVQLSIEGLDVNTVTKDDAEKINLARTLYNEAIKAYPGQFFFQNGINNKLKDFNTTLTAMEEKIK